MRAFIATAASLAALLVAITPGYAVNDGFISAGAGGYYEATTFETETDAYLGPQGQLRATGALDFVPWLSVQGDIVLDTHVFERNAPLTNTYQTLSAALHLLSRFPNDFLVGGFVQHSRLDDTESDGYAPHFYLRDFAGAEAQASMGNATLYVQGGGMWVDDRDGSDYFAHGYFVHSELRYFLTDDFKIDVHGGIAKLSWDQDDPPGSTTTWNAGVAGEYKLPDSPISLWASYDYYSASNPLVPDRPKFSHRVMVGLKISTDISLKTRDRSGASLNPVDMPLVREAAGPSTP